ncbi:hypothetical protein HPB50_028038 [Hyalomma asiaticum]|nr:hypothetical protein HPB50_028038 [Hyalomma asiaticum]
MPELVARDAKEATQTTVTEVETEEMDSRLAHLIEAKSSIQKRRRRERLKRRIRKKVTVISKKIENHCGTLARQQWE